MNSLIRVLLGFLLARRSVQRDVGLADHIAKALGFVLDELVELRTRGGEGFVAKGLELLGYVGAGQGLLDVALDLMWWRSLDGQGGGR